MIKAKAVPDERRRGGAGTKGQGAVLSRVPEFCPRFAGGGSARRLLGGRSTKDSARPGLRGSPRPPPPLTASRERLLPGNAQPPLSSSRSAQTAAFRRGGPAGPPSGRDRGGGHHAIPRPLGCCDIPAVMGLARSSNSLACGFRTKRIGKNEEKVNFPVHFSRVVSRNRGCLGCVGSVPLDGAQTPRIRFSPLFLAPGNTEHRSRGPGAAPRSAGVLCGRGWSWAPRNSGYATQGEVERPGTGNPFAPCILPAALRPLLAAVPLSLWGSPGLISR